jgi:hypothetical protein
MFHQSRTTPATDHRHDLGHHACTGCRPAGADSPKGRSRGHRVAGALSGLIAAGVALGVAEPVAAVIAEQSWPIVAVGGTVIDATPRRLKQFAIEHFGTNDKPSTTS